MVLNDAAAAHRAVAPRGSFEPGSRLIDESSATLSVEQIRDLITNDEAVDHDASCLIRFNDFNESGLNIMIYYFTKTTAWDDYLAARERLNISIMRIVEGLGVRALGHEGGPLVDAVGGRVDEPGHHQEDDHARALDA